MLKFYKVFRLNSKVFVYLKNGFFGQNKSWFNPLQTLTKPWAIIMKKEWSKISLIFFLVVALIGTLLRSIFFIPIPLGYRNLVHAHSHVAFQGWIYTIIILLLTNLYLKKNQIQKGRYPLQFKLTVFVLTGTLITFSLQGYGLYSILFSTLFQLLNYWFIYRRSPSGICL